MTASYISQIDPYWFGRPEAEVRAAVEARIKQWAPVPGYSRYEWSDKGRVRIGFINGHTGARVPGGQIMKTGVNNSGYGKVNVIRDDGKPVTVTVHKMVLLAHHPAFCGLAAFPAGLETRHNPATGPLFNAYPEGLWPGTRKENEADKDGPEGPRAYFKCKNAPRCRNLVAHEDRRCTDCVAEVGRQAAALLNAGMNLAAAAKVFGYTRGDWTYRLAARHGYAGTREQAMAQRPSSGRRLLLRLRRRSLLRRAAQSGDVQ